MAADAFIELENVYKVFGPQAHGRPLDLAKAGFGKDEVMARSGHVVGLNDVNFTVEQGEIFVVMGLSGSGKSTALRAVNRLLKTTHGSVWVDGVDVQTLKGSDLQAFRREKMGMVFQHFALFPHRSVRDNVGYGLKVQKASKSQRNEAAEEALALVGLDAYIDSMPNELSGGMQQRVGLARALASDPDILLMDEAFSALDPLIRRQMQDEMMDIHQTLQKTILFITHDLNEALRIGHRVCIMKDGAVVQIGTPEEILTQPATGYVAEFVQDVDQGRVMEVGDVMSEPAPLSENMNLNQAVTKLGRRTGEFIVNDQGIPTGLLMAADAMRVAKVGTTSLAPAVRKDFEQTTPDTRLNDVYALAGRGLPIAVLDENGKLIGTLYPRMIMERMGEVEQLIEGFEREEYL